MAFEDDALTILLKQADPTGVGGDQFAIANPAVAKLLTDSIYKGSVRTPGVNLVAPKAAIPAPAIKPITPQAPQGAIPPSAPAEQALAAYDPNEALRQHVQNRVEAGPGYSNEVRAAALTREHAKNGITASVDAKGLLVLQGVGVGSNSVTGNVQGIINQMKNTSDSDAMRGLMGSLNEAVAVESTKIMQTARKYAETKVGLPGLEAALQMSIQLDRDSPSYEMMGGADSDNTKAARAAVASARNEADKEVERSMQTNLTKNGLDAALKNASMEAQRISNIANKKDMIEARAEQAAETRKAIRDEKNEELAQKLTEDMKLNIKILNPVLANQDDKEIAGHFGKSMGNKDYVDAITADPSMLPRMAATGNAFSAAILKKREKDAGVPELETEKNLSDLKGIMGNEAAFQQALKMMPTPLNDEERNARSQQAATMALKAGGSPEEKAAVNAYRYEVAKAALMQSKTNRYTDDVSFWGSTNPELATAIEKAKTDLHKTDLPSVVTALIKDAPIEDRARLRALMIAELDKSTYRYANSALGGPNTMAIKNRIMEISMKSKLDEIQKALGTAWTQTPAGMAIENAGSAVGSVWDFLTKKEL